MSWAGVCTGDYTIDNVDTSADIAALSSCTEISGSLGIRNTTLSSLSALSNVTSMGGSLAVETNFDLTSLTGLENITSVGRYCPPARGNYRRHSGV